MSYSYEIYGPGPTKSEMAEFCTLMYLPDSTFLTAWNKFIADYGSVLEPGESFIFRGPVDVDLKRLPETRLRHVKYLSTYAEIGF